MSFFIVATVANGAIGATGATVATPTAFIGLILLFPFRIIDCKMFGHTVDIGILSIDKFRVAFEYFGHVFFWFKLFLKSGGA